MKDIFIGNQRIIILQGIEKNITLSNEMAQRLLRVYGLFTMRLTKHGQEVALGFAREDGVDAPVED